MKVTSAIIVKDNKILITQKGSKGRFAHKWEFPGGKVDTGETPEECILRELFEELRIRIQVESFFCECIHTYPEGQNIVLAYCCSWQSGEITLTEHSDYKWVSVEELLSNWPRRFPRVSPVVLLPFCATAPAMASPRRLPFEAFVLPLVVPLVVPQALNVAMPEMSMIGKMNFFI